MTYEVTEEKTILYKLKLVIEVVMILISLVTFIVAKLTSPEIADIIEDFGISSNISFFSSIFIGFIFCIIWILSNLSYNYPFISFSILFYCFVMALIKFQS